MLVRAASTGFEHARYLDEVAFVTCPPRLGALLRVIEAQGMKV